MADDTSKLSQIQTKLDREKKILDGNIRMRHASQNDQVKAQLDNAIRENRKGIGYLEGVLRETQARSVGGRMSNLSLGQNGGPAPPRHGQQQGYRGQMSPPTHQTGGQYGGDLGGYGDPHSGGYSRIGPDQGMPARGPFSPGPPGSPTTKNRPNYSKLDLIRHDTPHLGPRIQLMLSQLEFKVSVEKQYKDGLDKIIGSYRTDGDKKIRAEAQGRRTESMQKIQLLQRALKRYEDLHVDAESSADAPDDDSLNTPNLRKPLTGRLSVKINAVAEIDHISASRWTKKLETFVAVKVEDDILAKTKTTRNNQWTEETHDIDIDKGNELEITVYDKGAGAESTPVGMLWIRISDIAEEMRRKKIEMELHNSGWVSADRTLQDSNQPRPDFHFQPPPGSSGASPNHYAGGGFGQGPGGNLMQQPPQSGPVTVEGWFSLEPVGRIHLSMNFAKQTRERKPFDRGIVRQGAIRQRKEDVHELYGHKFVAQQFYNIMRCALCGELLKNALGYQCADCKYLCHEKCYTSVVTKCISRPNAESDPDEARLNHRIPHRFEPWGNIGANWCCHCGYMLPLGKKNSKRCKECKVTCHAQCTHLVPDFCGMSMKDANQILSKIKEAQANKTTMGTRTLRPPGREPAPRRPPATQAQSWQPDPTTGGPKQDRFSYGEEQAMAQQQSGDQLSQAASGAASSAWGAQSPTQQAPPTSPGRPANVRHQSSSFAAAAATNALAGKSPTETRAPQYSRTSSYQQPTDRPSQSSQHERYDPSRYANVDQPRYGQSQPPQINEPRAGPDYGRQQYQAPAPQPEPKRPQPQQQPSHGPPPTHEYTPSPVTKFVEQRPSAQATATRGTGKRIGLDHFNFLAVLGKGNFGKVMLAETKQAKQLYAIKVLKKEFIIENDEVESTKSERDVFIIANRARHPFLLNLHACFQTETRVYFVMEYISGGDLMLHIQRGQFGTKRAQFYAAEVCLALKYFHENGVVYRDLKLDNILLTLDGHIKIADYGLCKKDMYYGSTTSTFCGTPEFMAPEILLDKRYGRAVDWWAFGVLIYQMLLQQSPFRGEDEDEIYDAILADEPLYPIHMPRDSVSILQKLLTREPELRLGSGPTDAQEIMSHAFFRNVNWEDVYAKKVPAPFLPQIKNATDTSNFDSEFTSVTPVLTPVNSQLTPAMQEEFRGFSSETFATFDVVATSGNPPMEQDMRESRGGPHRSLEEKEEYFRNSGEDDGLTKGKLHEASIQAPEMAVSGSTDTVLPPPSRPPPKPPVSQTSPPGLDGNGAVTHERTPSDATTVADLNSTSNTNETKNMPAPDDSMPPTRTPTALSIPRAHYHRYTLSGNTEEFATAYQLDKLTSLEDDKFRETLTANVMKEAKQWFEKTTKPYAADYALRVLDWQRQRSSLPTVNPFGVDSGGHQISREASVPGLYMWLGFWTENEDLDSEMKGTSWSAHPDTTGSSPMTASFEDDTMPDADDEKHDESDQ